MGNFSERGHYYVFVMTQHGLIPANATPTQIAHAISFAQDACASMLSDASGGDAVLNWVLQFSAQHPETRTNRQAVSPDVAGFASIAAAAYCPSVSQ